MGSGGVLAISIKSLHRRSEKIDGDPMPKFRNPQLADHVDGVRVEFTARSQAVEHLECNGDVHNPDRKSEVLEGQELDN